LAARMVLNSASTFLVLVRYAVGRAISESGSQYAPLPTEHPCSALLRSPKFGSVLIRLRVAWLAQTGPEAQPFAAIAPQSDRLGKEKVRDYQGVCEYRYRDSKPASEE
jgi:hypothetical protein